jgi:hypothetical protein
MTDELWEAGPLEAPALATMRFPPEDGRRVA